MRNRTISEFGGSFCSSDHILCTAARGIYSVLVSPFDSMGNPIVNHFIRFRARPNNRKAFSMNALNWITHFPRFGNILPVYSNHASNPFYCFGIAITSIVNIIDASTKDAFIIRLYRGSKFVPTLRPPILISFHKTDKHSSYVPCGIGFRELPPSIKHRPNHEQSAKNATAKMPSANFSANFMANPNDERQR